MAKKTNFDNAVIEKVKEMRIKIGLTQYDVALFIDKSRGFIGQIESSQSESKYNLNHLNKLSLRMGCSPRDFIPEKPVEEPAQENKVLNKRATRKRTH